MKAKDPRSPKKPSKKNQEQQIRTILLQGPYTVISTALATCCNEIDQKNSAEEPEEKEAEEYTRAKEAIARALKETVYKVLEIFDHEEVEISKGKQEGKEVTSIAIKVTDDVKLKISSDGEIICTNLEGKRLTTLPHTVGRLDPNKIDKIPSEITKPTDYCRFVQTHFMKIIKSIVQALPEFILLDEAKNPTFLQLVKVACQAEQVFAPLLEEEVEDKFHSSHLVASALYEISVTYFSAHKYGSANRGGSTGIKDNLTILKELINRERNYILAEDAEIIKGLQTFPERLKAGFSSKARFEEAENNPDLRHGMRSAEAENPKQHQQGLLSHKKLKPPLKENGLSIELANIIGNQARSFFNDYKTIEWSEFEKEINNFTGDCENAFAACYPCLDKKSLHDQIAELILPLCIRKIKTEKVNKGNRDSQKTMKNLDSLSRDEEKYLTKEDLEQLQKVMPSLMPVIEHYLAEKNNQARAGHDIRFAEWFYYNKKEKPPTELLKKKAGIIRQYISNEFINLKVDGKNLGDIVARIAHEVPEYFCDKFTKITEKLAVETLSINDKFHAAVEEIHQKDGVISFKSENGLVKARASLNSSQMKSFQSELVKSKNPQSRKMTTVKVKGEIGHAGKKLGGKRFTYEVMKMTYRAERWEKELYMEDLEQTLAEKIFVEIIENYCIISGKEIPEPGDQDLIINWSLDIESKLSIYSNAIGKKLIELLKENHEKNAKGKPGKTIRPLKNALRENLVAQLIRATVESSSNMISNVSKKKADDESLETQDEDNQQNQKGRTAACVEVNENTKLGEDTYVRACESIITPFQTFYSLVFEKSKVARTGQATCSDEIDKQSSAKDSEEKQESEEHIKNKEDDTVEFEFSAKRSGQQYKGMLTVNLDRTEINGSLFNSSHALAEHYTESDIKDFLGCLADAATNVIDNLISKINQTLPQPDSKQQDSLKALVKEALDCYKQVLAPFSNIVNSLQKIYMTHAEKSTTNKINSPLLETFDQIIINKIIDLFFKTPNQNDDQDFNTPDEYLMHLTKANALLSNDTERSGHIEQFISSQLETTSGPRKLKIILQARRAGCDVRQASLALMTSKNYRLERMKTHCKNLFFRRLQRTFNQDSINQKHQFVIEYAIKFIIKKEATTRSNNPALFNMLISTRAIIHSFFLDPFAKHLKTLQENSPAFHQTNEKIQKYTKQLDQFIAKTLYPQLAKNYHTLSTSFGESIESKDRANLLTIINFMEKNRKILEDEELELITKNRALLGPNPRESAYQELICGLEQQHLEAQGNSTKEQPKVSAILEKICADAAASEDCNEFPFASQQVFDAHQPFVNTNYPKLIESVSRSYKEHAHSVLENNIQQSLQNQQQINDIAKQLATKLENGLHRIIKPDNPFFQDNKDHCDLPEPLCDLPKPLNELIPTRLKRRALNKKSSLPRYSNLDEGLALHKEISEKYRHESDIVLEFKEGLSSSRGWSFMYHHYLCKLREQATINPQIDENNIEEILEELKLEINRLFPKTEYTPEKADANQEKVQKLGTQQQSQLFPAQGFQGNVTHTTPAAPPQPVTPSNTTRNGN